MTVSDGGEVQVPGLTPQMQREAAILLLAFDSVLWDNMSLEAALTFARRFADYDQQEPWADGKHSGDCTKEAHSCARCQFENYERAARLIHESEDGIVEFMDTVLDGLRTPFDSD